VLLCTCCVPVRAGMSRKRRRPRGGRGASKRARTEVVGLAPQDAYIVGCVLEELLQQRPQNPSVFPEGHHRGHVAGRWLGFPATTTCMHAAEYKSQPARAYPIPDSHTIRAEIPAEILKERNRALIPNNSDRSRV
jgi:hypothetical protein